MSENTWKLVCLKKSWRNALRDSNRIRSQTLMAAAFAAWRFAQVGSDCLQTLQGFDDLLVAQDQACAWALFSFRELGKQVTLALRKDDGAFYEYLASSAAEFLDPHQVKQFWKCIRRSLPKFRDRRFGQDPIKLELLKDQWVPYFQQLEVGDTCEPHDLAGRCHERQTHMPVVQCVFHPNEVPSLIEVEDALRLSQPDRATGLDPLPSGLFRKHAVDLATIYYPLVLKMCFWQSEPITSKGGPMAVIYKKGTGLEAANYRGIMLLPTFAKRFHALIRTRLMALLHRQRPQGQMGGFPSMQVPFGSQVLRTFGRIMDAHAISSAVVFIDLANAFHRLIRELVSGVHVPDEVEVVLNALLDEGLPAQDVAKALELPCLLQQLGAPPFLIQLLQDLHTDTWMQAPADRSTIVTRRGTRPGSPLADCVFHILMADVVHHINVWLADHGPLQQVLQDVHVHVESVVWADDLAIPLATLEPSTLINSVEQALQKVHSLFASKGFILNLQKGKTSVVATFKGVGAAALRKRYQLGTNPGITTRLGNAEAFVHFVPQYKHLGTVFTSSHEMDQEIATRIGIARSAFAQLAKPIMCNRHLPLKTRLQMFRVLIETKLYFGLGAWAPPSARQIAKLQSALLYMLKRVLRFSHDEHVTCTVQEVFYKANLALPRARLALDRLMYAQKVWEHSPEMPQHLLHQEAACREDSWLRGLQHDLLWLHAIDPTGLPCIVQSDDARPDQLNLTELIEYWQSGNREWRVRVKRAWRRYHAQEHMMFELIGMHKTFFRTLQKNGATFSPSPVDGNEMDSGEFACHCGHTFTTAQGLACHKRFRHHEFAPEHAFIKSNTCPACLKFFWSRQRLYLHLAYIPRGTGINECFQKLCRSGFQDASDIVLPFQKLPARVRGLARVETLQAAGPLPMTADARATEVCILKSELGRLQEDLIITETPSDPNQASANLRDILSRVTMDWFQQFCEAGFDADLIQTLPDLWLAELGGPEGEFAEWHEAEFMGWGQDALPDVIAEFVDGVAESLVDEAFSDLVALFPRFDTMGRIAHIKARIRFLEDEQQKLFPHRPIHIGSANVRERFSTAAHVPARFEEQTQLFQKVRSAQWLDLPQADQLPIWRHIQEEPVFLIAHLFSGRRGQGDVHAHLHAWAQRAKVKILVLSLDTANSISYGNLHVASTTWAKLLKLYEGGFIAATLTGAPCETWSAACHHEIDRTDDEVAPDVRRWPRPLRSALRIFGLPNLCMREIRQLSQGTQFYLQTMITFAWAICTGGLYISEHPAPPHDDTIASVWTSPWTQVLRAHPDVALHIVGQWRWGCEVKKPTGLMTLRLPRFLSSMYGRALDDAKPPDAVAIGIGSDGRFRTSSLKEYPPAFCSALAGSLIDEIKRRKASGSCHSQGEPDLSLVQWVSEAEALCSQLREGATWLPDFQGRQP